MSYTNIHRFLQIKSAKRLEYLFFNLIDFHFFKSSEGGNIVFHGNPQMLSPLTVVSYILSMEVILFRGKRYFVKLKEQVVDIFVLREKPEVVYISNLAVAFEYRELGIPTYVPNYANKLAKRLNRKWLELSVLKVNILTLQLCEKLGFIEKKEKKLCFILRKKTI